MSLNSNKYDPCQQLSIQQKKSYVSKSLSRYLDPLKTVRVVNLLQSWQIIERVERWNIKARFRLRPKVSRMSKKVS